MDTIPEGDWFCIPCGIRKGSARKLKCKLCKQQGGLLIPVKPGDKVSGNSSIDGEGGDGDGSDGSSSSVVGGHADWVHLLCAIWVTETCIDVGNGDPSRMVAKDIESIPDSRWRVSA